MSASRQSTSTRGRSRRPFLRLLPVLVTGLLISGAGPGRALADPLDPNSYSSLGALNVAAGSVVFDTDTLTVSGAFSGTGVIQSQGVGLPEIAVFTFSSINLPAGVAVNVVGSRPIAILSTSDAVVHSLTVTPGAAGGASGGLAARGSGTGGGGYGAQSGIGGGGASFGGAGGAGSVFGQGAPYGDLTIALQAGSGGGGAGSLSVSPTQGGDGGGAVEIGAVGAVTLGGPGGSGGVFVNGALGSPGTLVCMFPSCFATGGGGGGSGGGILVHGSTVSGGALEATGGSGGIALDPGVRGGGGGGGGRVVVQVGSFTIGNAFPAANVAGAPGGTGVTQSGAPGSSGTAQVVTPLTILPSGFARQIGSDGTFMESASGFQPFQTGNLQVNAGGVAFATAAVTSTHDLSLQGGVVSAGQGWTAAANARISGFGQLAGAFGGGANNSVVASGGVLTVGNANSAAGFEFGGAITVGAGATLQVQDADQAVLGSSTTLAAGGRLASLNGALLGASQTLTATGGAAVEGAFTNQGMVNGPSEAGQFLSFADGVNGSGDYTGNIRFAGGFAPGSSPGLVTFAGDLVVEATSPLDMELGGLLPGTGYDKIEVGGLLTLNGGILNVLYWEGFTASAGNVFDLFDWGSRSGTFSQINLPTLSAGLSWDTSSFYTDGALSVTGVAAPIPEPETYAMLLAGLAVLGVAARRRKRMAAAA